MASPRERQRAEERDRAERIRLEEEQKEIDEYERNLHTLREEGSREMREERAARRQVQIAIIIGFGSFVSSLILSFPSAAIPLMEDDETLQVPNLTLKRLPFIMFLGAIFGTATSYFSLTAGWRKVLVQSMATCLVSWVILALGNSSESILIARFMSGFGLGAQNIAGMYYLHETTVQAHRALVLFITSLSTTSGFLCMAVLGQFFTWRGLAWVGAVASLPQLFTIFKIPETPYWFYRTCNWRKSLKAFQWLFVSKSESFSAFKRARELLMQSNEEEDIFDVLKRCFNLKPYHPLRAALLLQVGKQLCGINVYLSFLTILFRDFTGSLPLAQGCCVILMFINMITDVAFIKFHLCESRKKILKNSSDLMFYALISLASIFAFRLLYPETSRHGLLTLLVWSSISYMVAYSYGWGPLPDLFLQEGTLFVLQLEEISLILELKWAIASLTSTFFIALHKETGVYTYVLMFSVFSLLTSKISKSLDKQMVETLGVPRQAQEQYYERLNRSA